MTIVTQFSWDDIASPDFGNPARQAWPQAVAQVEEQLRTKLRVEVLPERLRKALELVGANAVTLQADGTASVQSGKQTYTLLRCGKVDKRLSMVSLASRGGDPWIPSSYGGAMATPCVKRSSWANSSISIQLAKS